MARPAERSTSADRLQPGARIAAVVSSYHGEITQAMLASAREELLAAGLAAEDLLVVDVPGAFEIPLVARELGVREDVSAVMCLGLVLKGETSHDFHIASSVSHALQRVALEVDKPVLFGVLTCATIEQARARAMPGERDNGERDNGERDKGREVARAAIGTLAALERAKSVGERQRRAGFFTKLGDEDQP